MRRSASILLSCAAGLTAIGWSSSAAASGDAGCEPDWYATTASFNGCDNSPMMQPGNDTRANLLLMMLDGRGIAPSTAREPKNSEAESYYSADTLFVPWWWFREYYVPTGKERSYGSGGSRCDSNETGAAAFIAAISAARGVSEAERATLIGARKGMTIDCDKESSLATPAANLAAQLSGSEAKAFGAYLDGALAFYQGNQSAARAAFEKASAAGKDDWLKDTARYMIARAQLNGASEGLYDKWGYRDEKVAIDNAKVKAAEDALNAYLKAYPNGRYAASARGLLRRTYWLGGDFKRLEAEYARLIGETGIVVPDLIEEIDLKLLPNASTSQHPMILAVMDLIRMRGESLGYSYKDCCEKPLTADDLAGQAAVFSKHPALYQYLQAAQAFYVGKNPKEVLRLIPDAAKQKEFSHIQFARQMLRGEALSATRDRNARGFFVEMLPGAKSQHQRWLVELAIANHDEKSGQVARVFEKGSPVQNAIIRRILLVNTADAPLLRQQATNAAVDKNERDVALFTLLKKELEAGHYKAFLSDIALLPAGLEPETGAYVYPYGDGAVQLGAFVGSVGSNLYPCPDIKGVITTLSGNPNDTKGQLCLADFMRERLDTGYWIDPTDNEALGTTKSPLEAKPYSRMAVYQKLIADPKVTGNDKAYALNRAIRCFQSSGYNHCGSQEIPVSQRKAWFQQLKRDYPNNPIATSLQYYW